MKKKSLLLFENVGCVDDEGGLITDAPLSILTCIYAFSLIATFVSNFSFANFSGGRVI